MAIITADRSLLGDMAVLGDGASLNDGPIYDDGVATTTPLIGVPTEASSQS